jgi:hypothetical protein
MTVQPRPRDNRKLVFCSAQSPTSFWRSVLHKDGSGRARSASIRTDIPDAHVTRWPSGRARLRPPLAPLIRKDGTAERLGVPAICQRAARSTSDLHVHMQHRVVHVPIQTRRPSGQHPATTARARGSPDIRAGGEKIALSQLGSDFLQCPLLYGWNIDGVHSHTTTRENEGCGTSGSWSRKRQ